MGNGNYVAFGGFICLEWLVYDSIMVHGARESSGVLPSLPEISFISAYMAQVLEPGVTKGASFLMQWPAVCN